MINNTFEELKLSGDLPSPSGVGMKILKLTQGEDFSTEEIGQTIMADSALTGRLLKLANSAQAGALEHITSVEEATIRLGISTVRNVALGLSLISANRSGQCMSFDYDRYWSHSIARAVAAQVLCRALRIGNPPEAYICGLLSQVGYLALASVYPEDYSTVLQSWKSRESSKLVAMERKRFGIDHREIGALMLGEWGLPEAFGDAGLGARHRWYVGGLQHLDRAGDAVLRPRQEDRGVVADVAVALNVFFSLAMLAAFQGTLTLPGIGALVLTIGMAVDANVLIYERIREELALGKTIRNAVQLGYDKAFTAIIDSNITTFLTGMILAAFGTGPIKGFAIMLMIGIACTLFTAVFITRAVFMLVLERDVQSVNFGQPKSRVI